MLYCPLCPTACLASTPMRRCLSSHVRLITGRELYSDRTNCMGREIDVIYLIDLSALVACSPFPIAKSYNMCTDDGPWLIISRWLSWYGIFFSGRIPSPDSCCRSQDSVGQENDNDAVPSRNCHRVRCTPSATGDHKLSSLSDCTETDGDDDDDESDCIREMRRVRCPGNLAEDETSREAALNFDDDAAHQIRRDGKTKGGAPTSNHRSEFIEMCSRKRKKLRRSHPTNIKSTRNSLPHGREEELEGAGKMELWTLEGELILCGTSLVCNLCRPK